MIEGRVGIVGLGLIGGSIARAMARGGHEVYAFDLNEDIETFAAIETTAGRLTDELVGTCELIVLACYPKACVDWLESHASLVSPDAIVIDTGGVKRSICEPCFDIARKSGITFVGYASGFERQGAADAEKLEEAVALAKKADTVLLCLDNDEAGHQASRRMREQLDARYSVERLIPENKDWNDDLTLSIENAQGLAMNEMR